MKKFLTLTVLVVALLSVALLSGCGPAGTYKFSQMNVTTREGSVNVRLGQEYDGTVFDSNSIIMIVKNDHTLEFKAPYFNFQTLYGDWEYIDGDKDAVLNVYNDGLEIITAEHRDGKVYLLIYANSIDYEIVLS